jgi:hypothetical protein
MDIKEILEKLKKEKDPEKFLKELLKTTKDNKLKKEIEKLLESFEKKWGESKLENLVRRSPVMVNDEPEITIPESRERVVRSGSRQDLVVDGKKGEDYGISSGGKGYKTGNAIKQLEESNLVAKGGHLENAETKGLIDKKLGEYDVNQKGDNYSSDDKYSKNDSRPEALKDKDEAFGDVFHRKKKHVGDYV